MKGEQEEKNALLKEKNVETGHRGNRSKAPSEGLAVKKGGKGGERSSAQGNSK